MPVNPDELLARADKHRERTTGIGKGFCVLCRGEWPCTTVGLAAALRAALATRPQPLFEGTGIELDEWMADQATSDLVSMRAVVYAVAGSATPTGEKRMMQGVWPAPAGDRTVAMEDVTGSATPARRGPCGLCGADPTRGHGSVTVDGQQVDLCHPDDGQDCYRLWTVYEQRPAAAESAIPAHRDEAGNEWVTPAEDMWQDDDDPAATGPARPTEADCTCVPGEGCDAEGNPGCRYCQVADSELPCPADDDVVAESATPQEDTND